jgi:hypothetical protein
MADFARVVAAVDRVLGTDGLATYERLTGRIAAEVVEGDPVAEAVRAFATSERTWQGTSADLLDKLTANLPSDRTPRDWPTTPRAMGGALKRAAPALRAVGIGVETGQREAGTGRRLVTLTNTAEEPSRPPPPPSQPSPNAADQPIRRDDWGDEWPDPDRNRHPLPSHPSTPTDQAIRDRRDEGDGRDDAWRPLSGDGQPRILDGWER